MHDAWIARIGETHENGNSDPVVRTCGDHDSNTSICNTSTNPTGNTRCVRASRTTSTESVLVRVKVAHVGIERSVQRHLPNGIVRTQEVRPRVNCVGTGESSLPLFRPVRQRLVPVDMQAVVEGG